MKSAIILGAGFSRNSDIPVEDEIPRLLISDASNSKFDHAVSTVLRRFMEDIFQYDGSCNEPSLDDIITCIDISTNSGHRLGIEYNSIRLRAIRRMLVYRLFSILEKSFVVSSDVINFLDRLTRKYPNSAYVVLNWDTALENYLNLMFENLLIDYSNGGTPLRYKDVGGRRVKIQIAKIHGSCNWLYCDNCRTVFNDMYNDITVYYKAGFHKRDFEMFNEFSKMGNELIDNKKAFCTICTNELSSHISTSSYRKSFMANSFPDVWKTAEGILSEAEKWIFIGYSLPEADYEFKHLLKIAELKLQHIRRKRLLIDVVLLKDEASVSKYRKFFGKRINVICNNGIKEYIGML
ncbi:MAG: hypothetical protein ACOX7R_02000 [Acetivibrionales bacterium]|jgi:hypothetical protein